MNQQTIVAVLQMLLLAEPEVVQVVHDLLKGTGGASDQAVLTQDVADWGDIITKAKAQIAAAKAAQPAGA